MKKQMMFLTLILGLVANAGLAMNSKPEEEKKSKSFTQRFLKKIFIPSEIDNHFWEINNELMIPNGVDFNCDDCNDMKPFDSFRKQADEISLKRQSRYEELTSCFPEERYKEYIEGKILHEKACMARNIELAREKYNQDQRDCLRKKEFDRLLIESLGY